ncbi:MAG: hypothetical protein KW788_04205 [Candidatus Doudnabacteria bacterium]|nr:hypothetical protein [Candidatus Doudnabacteria bacterium]
MSESGFPNHAEFARLETDMLTRDSQLLDIPTETLLKLALLDHMFAKHEESADLLWQLSERAYLDGLDPTRLFLAYTGGELLRQTDTKTTRAYTYSWACLDFETNRPYLHVMGFEQDKDTDPLEDSPTLFRQFLKVVRAEGSRIPDMQILGASIDEALTAIHPKIIKRVSIGPLYSPLLLNGDTDETEKYACTLLSHYSHRTSDFMLTLTTEVLFSESQKPTRGIFSSKRVMEIFHIPFTDEEAFRRRASMVRTNIMLPHVVNQHLTAEDAKVLIPAGARIVTYDEEGDVHGSA